MVNELGGVETSTSLVQLEASAGGGVGEGGGGVGGSEVRCSSEGDDWWD